MRLFLVLASYTASFFDQAINKEQKWAERVV